jgi:hypothetical protein
MSASIVKHRMRLPIEHLWSPRAHASIAVGVLASTLDISVPPGEKL